MLVLRRQEELSQHLEVLPLEGIKSRGNPESRSWTQVLHNMERLQSTVG